MSKLTERLLQIGVLVALLFYGWSLSRDTVLQMVRLSQQVQISAQQLQQCEAQLRAPKETAK